jgi:hypothetical protein
VNAEVLAKKILWSRGELSWKLHSAQSYLEETYRKIKGQLFVGNCSRQWGKSYWAVKTAIEVAIRIPKAQIRYGAAFQSDLVDFIIPAFENILEDAPAHVRGKKIGHYYVFPNGSRIKLVGLDKNPNGLRGNTLDLIVIDECGFVTNLDYIYKSVIVPATLHRPNCKIIMISTPPSTPAHPFVDYCQKAETEGAYVKLDIFTNPRITEDDIERMAQEMGGRDSTTFRRECLCEFITDSDLQIIPEWNDKYVQDLPRDEFFQYYHKYVGMDLGVKDLTAGIFGHYDFKRASLIIEDEFEMNGPSMNTLLLVGEIRKREKELWNNVEVPRDFNNNPIPFRRVSDNNWPILIQDLSSIHSLTFIETSKDNLEAMINEVRLMAQAGQLIVNPRCKKLIGCLRYGVWDNKKKSFARSNVYGHFDHLAALVYLIRNLAKGTNPIPATHGFENHKAWLGHVKDKARSSNNARQMAKALTPKPTKLHTNLHTKRGKLRGR